MTTIIFATLAASGEAVRRERERVERLRLPLSPEPLVAAWALHKTNEQIRVEGYLLDE